MTNNHCHRAGLEIFFGWALGACSNTSAQPPSQAKLICLSFLIGKTGKNLNLFIAGSNQRWAWWAGHGSAGCSLSGGGGWVRNLNFSQGSWCHFQWVSGVSTGKSLIGSQNHRIYPGFHCLDTLYNHIYFIYNHIFIPASFLTSAADHWYQLLSCIGPQLLGKPPP